MPIHILQSYNSMANILNIKDPDLVLNSTEYRFKRIWKSLYSFFTQIIHNVPTSLELGL